MASLINQPPFTFRNTVCRTIIRIRRFTIMQYDCQQSSHQTKHRTNIISPNSPSHAFLIIVDFNESIPRMVKRSLVTFHGNITVSKYVSSAPCNFVPMHFTDETQKKTNLDCFVHVCVFFFFTLIHTED